MFDANDSTPPFQLRKSIQIDKAIWKKFFHLVSAQPCEQISFEGAVLAFFVSLSGEESAFHAFAVIEAECQTNTLIILDDNF